MTRLEDEVFGLKDCLFGRHVLDIKWITWRIIEAYTGFKTLISGSSYFLRSLKLFMTDLKILIQVDSLKLGRFHSQIVNIVFQILI